MTKPKNPFGPLRTHAVVDPPTTSWGGQADPVADIKSLIERLGGKPKRRRRRGDGPEARIQKAFVAWARRHGLEVQHQNNGANSKAARIRLHALGCTAGAADILIFDRLPNYPTARGLALEFKVPGGGQTPEQWEWQQRLQIQGWRYHVVWAKQGAIDVVQRYGLALLPAPF